MTNKIKYELEIPFHASPQMIYQYISDAAGMSEWFADKVSVVKDIYSFTWNEEQRYAKLISNKTNEKVKYVWLDDTKKETDYFFEIKIVIDDITNDISLFITDFTYKDEIEDEKSLWKSIINDFKHIIGAE
ncbi:MAG: START-like domain-containing protein [Flavobacterium sp.]|jgi:hypothetical protein